MNKIVLTLVSAIFSIVVYCQTTEVSAKFNLGFERVENGKPTGWQANGGQNYKFSLDSTIVKNGKYAAAIEFMDGAPQFGMWGFILRENYEGKVITLSGYVKTENVEGYASLLMRIDPEIAFDQIKIAGTTEWKKYEISLRMNPKKTTNYALGAVLNGKGKIWVDDLKIFVDGKDIGELQSIELEALANQDNIDFDKGSNIRIEQLNTASIENLSALGLIWGFLKYYHPNIAKGYYNWDYELFKISPPILNAKNNVERDEIFVKWINDLGEFAEAKEEITHNFETKIKPDLDWIKNGGFSNELSSLLLNVKSANRTGQNYYVRYQLGGIPDFKNETEYTLAILELIGRIHDTHANILGDNQILTHYLGKQYAPVELTFIENKPVVTGFYDKKKGEDTGLKTGDVLTKINKVSVTEMVMNALKYTPASNYPTQLRDMATKLLRTNDSVIHVEFIRNSKIQRKVIKTYTDKEIDIPIRYLVTDTCFKMLNKEIAYINNGSLKRSYLPKIWEEIRNTKGLIIDDRNYPSDYPIYDLCNYLMPDATPFVKFSVGNIETPGLFSLGNARNTGKKNEDSYKGKVIILVNEQTQSSAELHAMAYSVHPNALIVGSTTAGADGDMSVFSLPGGISTAISGIGIYYPDGRETQRIGIVPDVEIRPTIQGVKEGRDEVVEKAIEIINKH
ncbi:MAG: peptidase S41 [Dysgonamonadaceae bacterium]|nr:peptidase S41 [Dysgonamonadaceae bacterium]